jgi:phosphate-selective porin
MIGRAGRVICCRLMRLSCSLLLALVCLRSAVHAQAADATGPTATIGGYVQYDYLAPLGERDDADQTFRFRRVRLSIAGTLVPKVEYGVSVEATGTPVLRDAFIALTHLPAANVQVGQFIMPYGLEQYVFSSNTLEFTERLLTPMVPSRDAGVMVWNAEPFGGWFTYAAAITNGTGMNVRDNNDAKDAMLRLTATPPRVPGLQVSVNAVRGEQPHGMRTRQGGDVSFDRRRYHLAAEIEVERIDGVRTREGAYVLGSWRFYPGTERSFLHHLEVGSRYGRITGTDPIGQWEASLNYYPRQHLRFMCNYIVHTKRAEGMPRSSLHARANIRF